MALILSIETATDICSVALHNDRSLIADFNLHVPRAHSNSLALLVDKVLDFTGIERKELSALVRTRLSN